MFLSAPERITAGDFLACWRTGTACAGALLAGGANIAVNEVHLIEEPFLMRARIARRQPMHVPLVRLQADTPLQATVRWLERRTALDSPAATYEIVAPRKFPYRVRVRNAHEAVKAEPPRSIRLGFLGREES